MLNSIVAAQGAHRFIYRSWEVETTGNPLSHAILRGAVNTHGEAIPNYHYEELRLLYDKYHAKNPALVVMSPRSCFTQLLKIAKICLICSSGYGYL